MAISKTRKRIIKKKKADASIDTQPAVVNSVSVDRLDLIEACRLFAFHETSKCQYYIRMAESGLSVNPSASRQRIAGLVALYNASICEIKQLHDSIVGLKTKTKKISSGTDAVLSPYYAANTSSKLPDNFTWPAQF